MPNKRSKRKYSEAELIAELDGFDGRKLGVSHPLSKFALPTFVDGPFAGIIASFIADTVLKEPDSKEFQAARWFLLESNAFFETCAEAGLDGPRLRKHLRKKIA
jgi:hypothetical protein